MSDKNNVPKQAYDTYSISVKKTNYFRIIFTDDKEQNSFHIDYQIRKTESAKIWLNCLQNAVRSGFSENDRFYNFPNHPRSNLGLMCSKLSKIIDDLNKVQPNLKIPYLDLADLKTSLQVLHLNFADSHLVLKSIDEKNVKLWRDFNTCIHAIEDLLLTSSTYLENLGLKTSRVVFTFNDPQTVEIPQSCYEDFCLNYQFGTAYINYSQVGKHFWEMYLTKDDLVIDAHIRPHRFFSADTYLWFGPTLGHDFEARIKQNMQTWFLERKERFNKLGFFWGDPKLAIGYVPVADMVEKISTLVGIKEFQSKLSEFTRIKNIEFFEA